MHLNRGLLNWGVFFVLLGTIPLAVRQGLLSEEAVARAWTLWPLLLIAAGIGLLLRRTPIEFAGGVITAATLGLIGGGLLASGGIPFAACGDKLGSAVSPVQRGELGPTAEVEIELNCGDLTIDTVDGTGWEVGINATEPPGPDIVASASSLEVHGARRGPFSFIGSRERWEITLPTAPTIDLAVAVNAGEGRLSLDGARLGRLELRANAGAVRLDLGSVAAIASLDLDLNAGEALVELPNLGLSGTVEANAASVRLCPPAGAGLRVRMNDNITASNNFAERGLVETTENVWETQGFGAAAVRLEIEADVNAGSIDVEPAGTCGG